MKIILADNQVSFRTGVARTLAQAVDCELLAQYADAPALRNALLVHPNAIVVFPSSLTPDLVSLLDAIESAHCHAILILEHDFTLPDELKSRVAGVVARSVTAEDLIDCVQRVFGGARCIHVDETKPPIAVDRVGERILRRLTPKELQIVALVGEGCKNKEIATQLGTKEQVIKNYLRSIYDKTGVSDRLELALYTLHHRALADAVSQIRATLNRRS